MTLSLKRTPKSHAIHCLADTTRRKQEKRKNRRDFLLDYNSLDYAHGIVREHLETNK